MKFRKKDNDNDFFFERKKKERKNIAKPREKIEDTDIIIINEK